MEYFHMDSGGIFNALDRSAVRLQRRSQAIAFDQLILFLVASVASNNSYLMHGINVTLIVAALCFTIALVLQLVTLSTRAEDSWKLVRAESELVKARSWLYAVGGKPFPVSQEADHEYASKMYQVLVTFQSKGIYVPAPRGSTSDDWIISDAMRKLRSMSLTERRQAYVEERVQDQRDWYVVKGRRLRRRANFWILLTLLLQVLVVLALLLKAFNVLPLDLFTAAGALGGAGATFAQNGQFRRLAQNYSESARSLAVVTDRLHSLQNLDEAEWSQMVGEIEDIILASSR